METMSEKIIAVLRQTPKGLTSRELSEATGKKMDAITSCAYRLMLQGKLERETERQERVLVCNTYRWRAKGK